MSGSNALDADENILADTDDGDNAPASAEANPADAAAEDEGDACFVAHPAINLSSRALLDLICTKPVISETRAPQPTPIEFPRSKFAFLTMILFLTLFKTIIHYLLITPVNNGPEACIVINSC